MSRGFIITIDTFLALSLLTLIMMLVISQDYGDRTFDALYLRSFSMEMLGSLEKSGILASSLEIPANLRGALNGLPPNMCAQLTLINSTNSTVMDVQKEGCAPEGAAYVAYRTFYANDSLYLAKSTVWQK